MTRISQIRYVCFWRRGAASSSHCRMRSRQASFPACPPRCGAMHSPASRCGLRSATAHGFLLVCGMNRHPHSIRRTSRCGVMILCVDRLLFSGTALGISVARRHGAALLWFHHLPGLGFQRKISRAAYARLGPTCGEIFLRTLHRKRVLTLGAGPCARLRPVCPEQIRRPTTEEITMYRNTVSLIGFAGKDAEPRTTTRTRTNRPANTSTAPNGTA
jgi:hypothetical protein